MSAVATGARAEEGGVRRMPSVVLLLARKLALALIWHHHYTLGTRSGRGEGRQQQQRAGGGDSDVCARRIRNGECGNKSKVEEVVGVVVAQ